MNNETHLTAASLDGIGKRPDKGKPEEMKKPAAVIPVLIADDSAFLHRIYINYFEGMGIPVDIVADGLSAVNKYESTEYAMILMDCQMPVMDGYQAAEIIRKLEQRKEGRIPIIALTAETNTEELKKCLDAGMDDFIIKPIKPDNLQAIVKKWLGTKSGLNNNVSDSKMMIKDARAAAQPVCEMAPVDLNVLKEYVDGDQDFAEFMIQDYLAGSKLKLAALNQAVAAGNAEDIRRTAHAFKPVNAYIGARNVVDILQSIEDFARANALAEVDNLIPKLLLAYRAVYDYLAKVEEVKQ